MYRIGLISDTHGQWDSRIARIFDGVSHIVHAGDIGSERVITRLEKIARVTAVKGNTDIDEMACYPEFTMVELCGLRFFVTHILGKSSGMKLDVMKALHLMRPDVVVYGHTHLYVAEQLSGALFVNPGSAGPKRFNNPRTAADLTVQDRNIIINFYDIDARESGRVLTSRSFTLPLPEPMQ
ncbi:MAG: metallophosphoesterase [Myxococcota bacterium]|jgi:hypothetical protein